MATDERKDRETEKPRKDEMKDLSAKRPDSDKEQQVKGGSGGPRKLEADLE